MRVTYQLVSACIWVQTLNRSECNKGWSSLLSWTGQFNANNHLVCLKTVTFAWPFTLIPDPISKIVKDEWIFGLMSVIFVQNIFGYVKPFIFGLAFWIMIIMDRDILVFDNSHLVDHSMCRLGTYIFLRLEQWIEIGNEISRLETVN